MRSSVDESLPVQATWVAEVDKQADAQARRLDVIQQLSLFTCRRRSQRFNLNNDMPEADKVRAIRLLQRTALVMDVQVALRLERNAAHLHLDLHCLLIRRFQEPGPQLIVYLHRRADDGIHLVL